MSKHFANTLNGMVKGADEELLTWPQGLVSMLSVVGVAFFVTDETLYLVLLVPCAIMLGFVLREGWRREPRHGKFGRVGPLSRSELTKAQAKLRKR
jgi:hypothetical protein